MENIFDKIQEIDNVFSDYERINISTYLNEPNWKWGHRGVMDTNNLFWNMLLTDTEYFRDILSKKVLSHIDGENCELKRIYANGQTYGLDGDFHTDCHTNSCGEGVSYTFLWYANEEWHPTWGGYTVFCDTPEITQESNYKYFLPKPNTALLFPGDILHYGQSPSRTFGGLRMTLAYKILVL